jgi:putative ABC transport system permease protein
MSTALAERPAPPVARRPDDGGRPARRAVVRWAWRLFRREWRQQLLVLTLLTVAVAATTAGTAAAINTLKPPETIVTLPGDDAQLTADIAAFRQRFGHVDAAAHQKIDVPGSIAQIDLRAPEPGSNNEPTTRLLAGRYPTGPGEVVVTRGVARIFDLQIGDQWRAASKNLRVVGLVENPGDLHDDFALLAQGQLDPPASVTVRLATARRLDNFRLPSGTGLTVEASSSTAKAAAAAAVLALSSLGLLFVGLIAVAGFAVMAQRRQRALGMLGSLGATDGHVRMVMLANGAVVGLAAAVVGAAGGLAGWIAFAPRMETIAAHRIDRYNLPWWAIAMAMALAMVTAIAAAWWPARAAARVSVVAALSGRPPRPQPAHRFAALGGFFLATGLGLLAFAHQRRPPFIIGGSLATVVGMLFVAPLAIRALAAAGRRAPIAVRLALRDLARYQARSGAALGAVALAVAIAATIAVSAAAAQATTDTTTGGNLPANQLVVYTSARSGGDLLPDLSPAQLQGIQARAHEIAAALATTDVVTLEAALNPDQASLPGLGNGPGGKEAAMIVKVTQVAKGTEEAGIAGLYVATPEILAHSGIPTSRIDPAADIISSRTDLAGLDIGYGRGLIAHPKIQVVSLPRYSSSPNTLLTAHAVQALGLQVVPAAWLIQTSRPLTATQINAARKLAASAGLAIETRNTKESLSVLGTDATAAGILFALAVLAMTVGLIRSETANDLRILAATGATSTTRRSLTGATAGALALLGALLGTAAAYLALTAWHRSDLRVLGHPPTVNLLVLVVALPLAAAAGGWLVAGREPAAIARRPMD